MESLQPVELDWVEIGFRWEHIIFVYSKYKLRAWRNGSLICTEDCNRIHPIKSIEELINL